MKERQYSYDYLRSVSCISVVILHVSSMYLKDDFFNLVSGMNWIISSFWRVITNLAVPSFVMLSGAFIIKHESIDFKFFYKKTFYRIIQPTLIFSIIYVLMHYVEIYMAKIMWGGVVGKADKMDLWSPVLNLVQGKPHGTMWYMYMIIPLYLVTPIIVMIKESISVKGYRRLAIMMLFYSILVDRTCSLSWILQFASWIGYFMLGDVIRERIEELKNHNIIRHGQIVGGSLIITSYLLLILYWYMFTYKTGELNIPSSTSWVVICSTLIQFVGISIITIKSSNTLNSNVAKYSLEIYLIHPIFCEILMQLFGRIIKWFPTAWLIPIYALAITAVCMGIAVLINYFINSKKHIINGR